MPVVKVDKVIVTNVGALQNKYGSQMPSIQDAIARVIAADDTRGLQTQLVAIDDLPTMRRLSGRPVTLQGDPAQNKAAIDAVYQALAPDYLMILGAVDVIPHQDLKNPMFGRSDPDRFAFGDIPYACEARYSQQPEDFVGPTRVVGRLPDLNNVPDAEYLIQLLNNAASYAPLDPDEFANYFAISAQVWQKSTALSVANTFANTENLRDVPPDNSNWSDAQLGTLAHFFNCHGANVSSQFYGQPADASEDYPVALDAAFVDGKLSRGAVASAECCYGGELYDPAMCQTQAGQAGLCNTYLKNGAWGFFASTTIAYGPAEGNAEADLICQYFLQNVLAGASLGRAALQARQQFVTSASPPDPSDIKTLAQFNLYGDPSIAPIKISATFSPSGVKALAPFTAERSDRADRRRALFRQGLSLADHTAVPRRSAKPARGVPASMRQKARELGIEPADTLLFTVRHAARPKSMPRGLVSPGSLTARFHVMFGKPVSEAKGRPDKERRSNIVRIVALVGKEVGGKLVSVKKIHSR